VSSTVRHDFAERLRDVQLARARLATLSLPELLERLPPEAARACGLERAVLEIVRAGRFERAPCEVVGRRRPLLVRDGAAAPAELPGCTSFVVAPLVHAHRPIAVLYGDRPAGPELDEFDRDLLWTFASAAASALHMATLSAVARTR
jgi:hypothetical protein